MFEKSILKRQDRVVLKRYDEWYNYGVQIYVKEIVKLESLEPQKTLKKRKQI